jgi:hypothetical protein
MKGLNFVVLKKNGNVLNKKITVEDNLNDLLFNVTDKRFKMTVKPIRLYSYNIDNCRLDIYGYIEGKSGQENSHDLPPSAKYYLDDFKKSDTDLLFADSFALKYKDGELVNMTIDEYAKYYEELLGGFEDLGSEDSYSSDEAPEPEDLEFIVDDDDGLSTDEDWAPEDAPKEEEETLELDSETDSDEEDLEEA